MAQHDYTIANQTFPNTRTDLNNVFAAIVSQNSGATAPSTTYAYQLWYDTTTDILKMRNANDDAWIELFTIDQVADTASPAGAVVANPSLIINGGMTVSQRGTSETGITSSRYADAPDRYKITVVSGGTWTASQTTTAPAGFSNSYKLECTATSTNTAMAVRLEHRFEGQDLQHLQKGTANAESVTLSFWVRSSTTGTYIANLTDLDNTRQISNSYTINSADTWEYKTLTFAGDTSGVLDNDNGNSLRIEWWLAAGTDYTSGTLQTSWAARVNANQGVGQTNLAATANNDFYLTGVKLEVGSTATDFVHRSYGEELARCQRYYFQRSIQAFFSRWNTNRSTIFFHHPVDMRASPTLSYTLYSGSTLLTKIDNRASQIYVDAAESNSLTNFTADAEL